jgi:hypothetical protein
MPGLPAEDRRMEFSQIGDPRRAALYRRSFYREAAFMGFAGFTFIVGAGLFFIDLPALQVFMKPHLIGLAF